MTRAAQLEALLLELLDACDMEQHNEDIFKGRWKKGSKAWNGDFVAQRKAAAMANARAAVADWLTDRIAALASPAQFYCEAFELAHKCRTQCNTCKAVSAPTTAKAVPASPAAEPAPTQSGQYMRSTPSGYSEGQAVVIAQGADQFLCLSQDRCITQCNGCATNQSANEALEARERAEAAQRDGEGSLSTKSPIYGEQGQSSAHPEVAEMVAFLDGIDWPTISLGYEIFQIDARCKQAAALLARLSLANAELRTNLQAIREHLDAYKRCDFPEHATAEARGFERGVISGFAMCRTAAIEVCVQILDCSIVGVSTNRVVHEISKRILALLPAEKKERT